MSEKSRPEIEKKAPGPHGSGGSGINPEVPIAGEHRAHNRKSTATRQIERATALRRQGIGRPPAQKNVVRRQTYGDIFGRDPEIPYVKFEAALRDLVCSLMERQDRMNEEIFYRINDLGSRISDLEDCRQNSGGGQ